MDRQPPSLSPSCGENAGTDGQMSGYDTRGRRLFHNACDNTYRKRLALCRNGLWLSHPAIEKLHETEDAKKKFIQRVATRHKLSANEVKYIVIRSCIHVYSFVNAFVLFIRFFLYSFMYTTRHIFCFKIARWFRERGGGVLSHMGNGQLLGW
jgi:hypothetical protein